MIKKKNITFGKHHFKCNLSIGRGNQIDDPWFILSNIEPNQAIREYSHRFGGIEMFFKSQKSNGFNLKKLELETFILLKIYTALFVLLGFDLVFLQLTILKIMLMLKIILILDILKKTKMVSLFAYYLYLI